MRWVALFSQTGSEIEGISKNLRTPDICYTNNPDIQYKNNFVSKIVEKKYSTNEVYNDIRYLYTYNTIITLNGWLRIVPKDITNRFEIYNVHPGNIEKYPELKGIHPQQKALDLGLKDTGVVIHRVNEKVDDGEIVATATCNIDKDETVDTLSNKLRNLSITLWTDFLKERL